MINRERRHSKDGTNSVLEKMLNPAQLRALHELEHFGWRLKYVRKPLFQSAVPIVFDRAQEKFAVIEDDGSINDKPGFTPRP